MWRPTSLQTLWRLVSVVSRHPLNRDRPIQALARVARWQLGTRILRMPVIMPWVNGTHMEISRGQTAGAGNFYVGLYEFEEMAFVLHFLGLPDSFVDIGANIGSFSILAASVGADVLAIEPVPQTFDSLSQNIAHNAGCIGTIEALNVGLSDKAGELLFTTDLGAMNHIVAITDASATDADAVALPVRRLDDVVAGRRPSLMKIDAEGHELEILRGSPDVLQMPELTALIIEMNGSFGDSDENADSLLRTHGFQPTGYDPMSRSLRLHAKPNAAGNTVYVRNVSDIEQRLVQSPAFEIHGRAI